jgi:sulfite reductase (ferredoxin)
MVKLSPVETAKAQSNYLRGTLREELGQDTSAFGKGALAVLKFHGIYQQDDRDARKSGPEKSYSCMVRVSIPGGILTAEQYLALDGLSDSIGDGTLRITSRQGIQYHYVGKRDLKQLIQGVIGAGLNTWAACGDVVRNVVACSAPFETEERKNIDQYFRLLAKELKPQTEAYAEIWLDGEKAASIEPDQVVEPLYGQTYLPRKFKIGFTYSGDNTTDIYSQDLGFVPHYENGELQGFTLLAGGGLGQTNGIKASFPRLADEVCFIRPDQLLDAAKAVVGIHRDFGNRESRKLARLKYVIEARGLEWFRQELASRLGLEQLDPPKKLEWRRQADYLGWHRQNAEARFFGLRVISGRITKPWRAAIREAVETLRCEIRLTAQQNLIFAGIAPSDEARLEEILTRHGITFPDRLPPVLKLSMACPALPTCGLALTDSERVLPDVAAQIQTELDNAGLAGLDVFLRTTGCPNGCARPYTAEIGIVGQSVGLYSLYLGGSAVSDRMAKLYKHGVKFAEIGPALRPLIEQFAAARQPGESLGDFFHRNIN